MSKERTSITISTDVKQAAKEVAQNESRSLSSLIEWLLKQYVTKQTKSQ